jgi:cytochrome d ubiquinol oxidase subunit II
MGYALLGVTWLILKTEGALQERLFRLLPIFVRGTLISVAAVSLWTPLLSPDIADIWYAWPDSLLLWAVPVAVLMLGLTLLSEIRSRKSSTLYPLTLLIYSVSFLGIGVSVYPSLVPREITIAAAAAPHSSLAFLLVGSALLLPVILAYTGYTYWLFRGKARAGDSH